MENNNKLLKMWSACIHCPLKDESILGEIIDRSKPNYVYIKLEDDNDYLISNYINLNTRVILELNNLKEFGLFIKFHYDAIGHSPWITLVPPEFIEMDELESLKLSPWTNDVGLKEPSIGDLTKWKTRFKNYPKLITVTYNNFGQDLIDYCKKYSIIVMFTEIFNTSDKYPKEFLLTYACKYGNLVCIDVNTIEDVLIYYNYLLDSFGKYLSDITYQTINNMQPPKYFKDLKSSSINEILNMDNNNIIVAVENPTNNILRYCEFSQNSINKTKSDVTEIEKAILNLTSDIIPSDVKSIGEVRYFLRNTVKSLLKSSLKPFLKMARVQVYHLADNLVVFNCYNSKLSKSPRVFILNINSDFSMIFSEISKKAI